MCMFKFLRSKKKVDTVAISSQKVSKQWSMGLRRMRDRLQDNLMQLLRGKRAIDKSLWLNLQTQLLQTDMGTAITEEVLGLLKAQVKKQSIDHSEDLLFILKQVLHDLIAPYAQPFVIDVAKKPYVVLMVGVNGSGKTTTLGKLANHLSVQGHSVMLAAGDTFRAAAVEQLKIWGERAQVPVIAQGAGADSAAVIFDALSASKARHIDLLLADTAGRLHNKAHLMSELAKIKRVLAKKDTTAPHEILLVIDATCGQNALLQAEQFIDTIGVTGLVLTKLDGTAKGGIVFAITKQFNLPIRFIGMGEKIEDLQPFNAEHFIDALL